MFAKTVMGKFLTFFIIIHIGWGQNQDIKHLVQLGQYAKAIDGFNKIEIPTTENKLSLAKAYCAKGMTSDCLKTYEMALTGSPPDKFLTSKFQYARLLQTQKKFDESDSLYTALLQTLPNHAEILYQKGKIADAQHKIGYHEFYLDALVYDPKHIKAAHEVVRYFMEVDNLVIAKNICFKTLDLVPNTPRLINLTAQIFYREKNWQTGLKYIEKLETLKADLPKFIYKIKGNIYLNLEQPENALKAFKKAFLKDQNDIDLALKIAETYLYLNDHKKAIRYLMIYELKRDTSMWKFNFLMGKYNLKKQKYKIAFYHFQKAYDENNNHEDSQYYRAVAADYAFDDKSKVLDYYTNYIETYEDEKDAKYINTALKRETEIRRELFMKK